MPTQNPPPLDSTNDLYHIYNKGVENRILFKDSQDYGVFLGFLKEYLTVPLGREDIKKTFSIKGKTFQGIPHQPKNYFNSVELLAFSLKPDHFHLVVNQTVKGSVEKLIRSLSTRYAIYYNKKCQRNGSLFVGPYKSVQIKDVSQLLLLTRHLHRESIDKTQEESYSSYKEYLGSRITDWVKPGIVLSYFDKFKNDYFKGIGSYKHYVETYTLKKNEKDVLERIIFDARVKPFETVSDDSLAPSEETKIRTNKNKFAKDMSAKSAPGSKFVSATFIVSSTLIFILLSSLGVRNIRSYLSQTTNTVISVQPTPEVSGASDVESEPISMLTVKITDGAEFVNLRKEASTKSEIIGKAVDGEVFEYISKEGNWYQIKLDNGSFAFISANYVQITEMLNN